MWYYAFFNIKKRMSGILMWIFFFILLFHRNCYLAKSMNSECVHCRKRPSRTAQEDPASCSPFVGPSALKRGSSFHTPSELSALPHAHKESLGSLPHFIPLQQD